VAIHADLTAAVESIIEGCAALYEQYHEMGDRCDVSCIYEGERVIGFRLSRDADGRQLGDDEKFLATRVEF
jgi:hypothetical protein